MARQTSFSKLNPFAMRPVEDDRPAQYHRGHLDTDWQQGLLMPWQIPAVYHQKVERGQRFRFAFDATDNTTRTLKVINCKGVAVLTIAQSGTTDVPGNKTADGSQLHSYVYRLANLNAIAADGTYYLLLTVTYDVSNTKQWISEPFSLANEHPGTIAIEYRNSENKDRLWFEQLPILPLLRVEGYISDLKPVSADTVYEDQGYNMDQLDSTAYRQWTLHLGENGVGLPDYMLDKLNHIFSCDAVYLDGVQYRKNAAGATIEPGDSGQNPLKNATIVIREADNSAGDSFTDAAVDIYTPPAPPYVLQTANLNTATSTLQLIPTPQIVNDAAAEAAMIVARNNALASQELFGAIAKTSGTVRYNNGVGEKFISGSAVVYATFFSFTYPSPGPIFPGPLLPTLPLSFRRGTGVVDWGDGTFDVIPFSVGNTTLQHQYTGAAGNYTVRIFGRMEGFGVTAPRTGLTGTLPTGLQSLSIFGGTFPSNTFNFSILDPVKATLNSLAIQNAGLTAANGFNSYYMPNLQYIDFSGNAFNSTVMGAFMYDVHKNASNSGTNNPVISNGVFSIGGQTTGASLNAQGNTYRNILQASPFFWTINA